MNFLAPAHESETPGREAWQPDLDLSPRASLGRLVDSIAGLDRLMSELQARRALLVDQARQQADELHHENTSPDGPRWSHSTIARKTVVSELACALRIGERAAESLVAESELLLHGMGRTRAALADGQISYRHAKTIIDHALSVPEDNRREFERAALSAAKTLTVAKLDRRARSIRERLHPESIADRREKAIDDREVSYQPARDGMAWLSQYQPAEVALAAFNRITAIARGLQSPDETRTLTQLRADVAADLLIDGSTADRPEQGELPVSPGVGRGIHATVHVTVPVLTLLGHDEQPAELEGHGPISPEVARRLAAHAPSFSRILTHPETGAVLSVGRDSYVVPADLRRWLQVQDGTCRFPGCGRSARQCEVDHQLDWQFGGTTSSDNLADLCPKHHAYKHKTDWQYRHLPDGTIEWTSPSGRPYQTEPAVIIGPAAAAHEAAR
jgi:hypothetical protein